MEGPALLLEDEEELLEEADPVVDTRVVKLPDKGDTKVVVNGTKGEKLRDVLKRVDDRRDAVDEDVAEFLRDDVVLTVLGLPTSLLVKFKAS